MRCHARFSLLCWLLLLTLAVPCARAQLTLNFQPREDLNSRLPASIRVFQADTVLTRGNAANPVRVFLVRADTSDQSWELRALLSGDSDGYQTTSSFALESDALIAINAGYFGGGQSYSLVAEDGQVLAANIGALNRGGVVYYPTRGAFAQLSDGTFDVAWVYPLSGQTYAYPRPNANTQQQAQPQPTAAFPAGGSVWPLGTGVGGGPVLVEDGQRRITWEAEVFFGSGIGDTTALQPRTAVGYTPAGELLLVVADGRQTASAGLTLVELADLFIGLGAVEALNLDGGGSSTMVAAGSLVNRPEGGTGQRQVASALVLARPQDTGGENPSGEIIFDTGDAGYQENGDWFESANTPFWGETKAHLNAVGSGEDRAVFTLNGIAAGSYEVSAWWVPSFNRATNTPYTIYAGGVPTVVRVNQADATTQNRWNVLGTFTLAPGDSVVVTDDAQGTSSPAYVVVDAIRLVPATTSVAGNAAPGRAAFGLFPNPARDQVALRLQVQAASGRAVVYDAVGRAVAQVDLSAGGTEHLLDVSTWAAGLYFVRVETATGSGTRPFVVVR